MVQHLRASEIYHSHAAALRLHANVIQLPIEVDDLVLPDVFGCCEDLLEGCAASRRVHFSEHFGKRSTSVVDADRGQPVVEGGQSGYSRRTLEFLHDHAFLHAGLLLHFAGLQRHPLNTIVIIFPSPNRPHLVPPNRLAREFSAPCSFAESSVHPRRLFARFDPVLLGEEGPPVFRAGIVVPHGIWSRLWAFVCFGAGDLVDLETDVAEAIPAPPHQRRPEGRVCPSRARFPSSNRKGLLLGRDVAATPAAGERHVFGYRRTKADPRVKQHCLRAKREVVIGAEKQASSWRRTIYL
mmetsp:Transcript_7656/g.18509  ORF Transcript_7656/g.18509 Transcript_7656/m.18509 type:complete len:296 (-) Transcript_7656:1528-2415(-)